MGRTLPSYTYSLQREIEKIGESTKYGFSPFTSYTLES
jgi:hypothetical protein